MQRQKLFHSLEAYKIGDRKIQSADETRMKSERNNICENLLKSLANQKD